MNKITLFEADNDRVKALDLNGLTRDSHKMYRQYQRRNSFSLDRDKPLYRIFQKNFYDKDVADGVLTLPQAAANVWNDPLENPLASITGIDTVTGHPIDFGTLVRDFYALCWTERETATDNDWESFARGNPAVRIGTTVGKLMDRLMLPQDPYYMLRYWLCQVEYKNSDLISAMKNEGEVKSRMESNGALLALSAAVVRNDFSLKDEVRLLFDASIRPQQAGVLNHQKPNLVRIPFNWHDFVDTEIVG